MTDRRELIRSASHIVVKIGSAVLLRDRERVDRGTFVGLVAQLAALIESGHRITVVSSGAVALGRQQVPAAKPDAPVELPRLQALAALGQARLIQMYDRELAEYGHRAAQILLGRADLDQRASFLNARLTIEAVHGLGAIPIINENDTVATEELRFGDNDELAAMTCGIARADLLVILSDVSGVLEVTPTGFGDRIPAIAADDPRLDGLAGPSASGFGRGGMVSKVASARRAARFGCPTIIAPGKRPGVLTALAAGDDVGTLITPGSSDPLHGRKVWLGAGAIAAGALHCDAGAVSAVKERGASLLPSGVKAVDGDFGEGAVVDLLRPDGVPFARGISTYSSTDVRRIAGRNSAEIPEILGYTILNAAVHRDNLFVL